MPNKTIHHFATHSAASSFYFFICIIPFVSVIMSLIPYFPIHEQSLIQFVGSLVPASIEEFVVSIINELYNNSAGVLSISLLFMLWSSSRVMVAISNGLNDIHDLEDKRHFLLVRLWATLYTGLTIVMLLVIMVIGVFGRKVLKWIMKWNFMQLFPLQVVGNILQYRQLIFLIGLFLLFLGLYSFLPAQRKKIKTQIVGAVVSALAWWCFSWVYKALLGGWLSFSMYGSLATIVIVLMSFNFSFSFFFVGGQINAYLEKKPYMKISTRSENKTKTKR